MRIVVDAMGGDHAPAAQVEGAVRAVQELPVEVILVGDEPSIIKQLEGKEFDRSKLFVIHTTEVISNNEPPLKAIREKKNSSMVVAANMLKNDQADAFVSAGSTGALLGAGTLLVGRIKGVERPALAPALPSDKGPWLLVDAGANVDCKPSHLLQFAIMGSIYMSEVMGIMEPRVALVNVGEEEKKGNELTKAVTPMLKAAPIHFTGNIEAREIPMGKADVIVCDGFVGNVILKLTEGLAQMFMGNLKNIFYRTPVTKLGALTVKKGLVDFKKKMDYTEYGGALLLGTRYPVIKAHGSSNAKAKFYAIKQANKFAEAKVTEKIAEEMKQSLKENTNAD